MTITSQFQSHFAVAFLLPFLSISIVARAEISLNEDGIGELSSTAQAKARCLLSSIQLGAKDEKSGKAPRTPQFGDWESVQTRAADGAGLVKSELCPSKAQFSFEPCSIFVIQRNRSGLWWYDPFRNRVKVNADTLKSPRPRVFAVSP